MESDNPTEEQASAIAQFQEFTGIDSFETSVNYLTMYDWNVQNAVDAVLLSPNDIPPARNEPPVPSAPPYHSQKVVPRFSFAVFRNLPRYALQLFRFPLSFLYTVYVRCQPFLQFRFLRVALTYFRSFWRPSVPPPNPVDQVEAYCTYFNNKFGMNHPVFYRGLLTQAYRDAQREVRLVFVYLHDKNSALCDQFCREVLCNDAFECILGQNLLWSASRDTQEGANACRLLDIRTFPCLCIIAHHGSQQTVEFKLEEYSDPDMCMAEIINALEHANQRLQLNRERRQQNYLRERLLEEQNAAYLDSVRADQEKAEQRLREESERRQLEEEEQRKLQEFTDFRDGIRQTLPSEPPGTENDIIHVSIRLPIAEPIRRRFRRTDPARLLFEFAWADPNVPNQFVLLWGYPRKRYQYEQITSETTIGDLINGNTETCFLEQIDEDK